MGTSAMTRAAYRACPECHQVGGYHLFGCPVQLEIMVSRVFPPARERDWLPKPDVDQSGFE
jgi:hypothetical protein